MVDMTLVEAAKKGEWVYWCFRSIPTCDINNIITLWIGPKKLKKLAEDDAGDKSDKSTTTSAPGGSTTETPVGETTTMAPNPSSTSSRPTKSKNGSTTASPGSRTTISPSKLDDDAMRKLQDDAAEEKELIEKMSVAFKNWRSWVEIHDLRTLNRYLVKAHSMEEAGFMWKILAKNRSRNIVDGIPSSYSLMHRGPTKTFRGLHTVSVWYRTYGIIKNVIYIEMVFKFIPSSSEISH